MTPFVSSNLNSIVYASMHSSMMIPFLVPAKSFGQDLSGAEEDFWSCWDRVEVFG